MKAPKTKALALGDVGHNEDSGKDRGSREREASGMRLAWTDLLFVESVVECSDVCLFPLLCLPISLSLFLSHLPLNLKWMNSLNWHDPQFNPIANFTSES